MKKILIAIDDGPISEKVAAHGFLLGQQLNAEIALVSIIDTTALLAGDGVTANDLADVKKISLQKNHQVLIDKVFKNFKVWTFVEEGKPSEAILKTAEEWGADIIVLGTHGRTGISHFLLGSVAEMVVRHSAKPLFIIPVKS